LRCWRKSGSGQNDGSPSYPRVSTSASKEYPDRKAALAKDRDGFRESWERTLDILGNDDLLDHVLDVDLDQEFPFFSPFRDELSELAKKPSGGARSRQPWRRSASLSKG
jgi:hypothetical protein